jgi:hypothetical protein
MAEAKVVLKGQDDGSLDAMVRKAEQGFRQLGVRSDAEYARLRAKATETYAGIAASAQSTANDVVRAEEAKNAKIAALTEQQLGKQTSMLSTLKANWIAASAAVVGAWMLVDKAVAMMDQGAKAMQVESSFKIMADSAGVSADSMIESMKRATRETIDDSDLMGKAVKLMTLGYDPAQIERFSAVVITASQIAGTTAAQAFDELGDALANRTPKAMIRMGAVTREQMKIVTEAIAAGAESTVLFELAMANLELKQKMLAGTQDQATISMQRYHAVMNEASETAGKFAIGVGAYLTAGALGLDAFATRATAAAMKIAGREDDYTMLMAAAEEMMKKRNALLGVQTGEEGKATAAEIASKKAVVDAQMAKLKATADAKEAATQAKKSEEDFAKAYGASIDLQLKGLDDVAKAEWALSEIRQKAHADAVKGLQDVYTQATAAYQKHIAEIKKIDADALAAKTGTGDLLSGIRQAGMTPAEAFADREQVAQEKLAAAMKLTGQDQIDALKAVQREYGSLAQEASKAAQETAKATAASKESADFTWDQYQSQAGQRSAAGKAFWGEPGPSDTRGTSAGAFMESLAAKPFGQAGQSAKQIAQADAQKLAETVRQIGTQIDQAYTKARAEASGAAREAEKIVDATKLTIELLGSEIAAVDSLTAAFQRAADAASALNAAKAAGAMAPVSGGGYEGRMEQIITESNQDIADNIVDAIRNPDGGGGGEGDYSGASGIVIPGPMGAPRLGTAHGGEVLAPPETIVAALSAALQRGGGGGGQAPVNIYINGAKVAQAIRPDVQREIRGGWLGTS